MAKTNKVINPRSLVLHGLIFALPFLFLNYVVGSNLEPFISMMRPSGHTSFFEIILFAIVWIFLGIGAFVSFLPMIGKKSKGARKIYPLNIIVTLMLVTLFVLLSNFWAEMYQCEFLKIPNCD